jgi:hypothetical protein
VSIREARMLNDPTGAQKLEFKKLAAALQYLRTSLHGAILDTLRSYQLLREVSLPESGAVEEPSMDDVTNDSELWDILKGLFSNPREQRLAYLLSLWPGSQGDCATLLTRVGFCASNLCSAAHHHGASITPRRYPALAAQLARFCSCITG